MAALTWTIALLLAVFSARRYLFLIASLLPFRPIRPSHGSRVTVLGAFKNEESALPALLSALDASTYPATNVTYRFVNDGSTDRTPELLERWAATHGNACVLNLPESHGKSRALNLALDGAPPSELIAVYDADTRPEASHLAALAGAFDDPRVAGASGSLLPSNAAQSVVARYAALETWVYQTVILAGKDRCGLNPPTVGSNCLYRRADLEAVGGFPPGSLSEDIELSLEFVRAGKRTRWIRQAESRMLVATSLTGFLRQRTRWTSGLYSSRKRARGIETWLTAAGYLDRLILLAALVLVAMNQLNIVWLVAYFGAPFAAMLVALLRSRDAGARWVYFLVTPAMFVVDMAASTWSTVLHLSRTPIEWRTGGA